MIVNAFAHAVFSSGLPSFNVLFNNQYLGKMGFLDKLFNLNKTAEEAAPQMPAQSPIKMGRYSDNNKTLAKTQRWYDAEDLFKDKKYNESIEAFFDYLRDEDEDNVRLVKSGDSRYTFEIYQGTKIVQGEINEHEVTAHVSLAGMEKGLIPVMRRLLEMNYSLFYSRYALHETRLCMLFDTLRDGASPNKLYYGLKELAVKADKQDDLLLSDFATLKAMDDSHVMPFSDAEKEVKYKYYTFWIESTLKRIEELNQDSFSGGIAYLFLSLIYKLDFLITPEGRLLHEIEKINIQYWVNKDEKTTVERNQMMKDSFQKLLQWDKAEVLKYFYRAKSTFSTNVPKQHTVIADCIKGACENMLWYKENKYPDIAMHILEYGLSYCQYSYSLPRPVTELFTLLMQISYYAFFEELGFQQKYYNGSDFRIPEIKRTVSGIVSMYKEKYPLLNFDVERLNFSSLLEFSTSFMRQIEEFNFESK